MSDVTQAAPSLGARVLEVARSQLGVTEVPFGSNTGREIRGYLAPCVRGGLRVGLTAGEWCAAFASWCVWSEWLRDRDGSVIADTRRSRIRTRAPPRPSPAAPTRAAAPTGPRYRSTRAGAPRCRRCH